MLHQSATQFQPAPNNRADRRDAALIRLCKTAVEALKEDRAACGESSDLCSAFHAQRPPYPASSTCLELKGCEYGVAKLREIFRELKPTASPTMCKGMREWIAKVRVWEQEVAALEKSSGSKAAERRADRTTSRVHDLVKKVAARTAQTSAGAAAKAEVMHYWLLDGYELGCEKAGDALVMSILEDVKLLGGARNAISAN